MSNLNGLTIGLLSGSAKTFAIRILGMILGYGLTYSISLRLGASGVGYFQLFMQIMTVLGMTFGLGLNSAVLRYAGQFSASDRGQLHFVNRHVLRTVIPITIGAAVILFCCSEVISSWIGPASELQDILKFVAIGLPLFTLNQVSIEFLRGLKKLMISESLRSLVRPIVMLLGILLLSSVSLTRNDLLFFFLIGAFANLLVSRIAIFRELNCVERSKGGIGQREILKTALPMLTTGLSSAIIGAMPIFFLGFFFTEREVGIYSVAFRLSSFVSLSLVVVNTIAAPSFAELFWSSNRDGLQSLVNRATQWMVMSSLAVCVILFAFGEWVLGLFGEEFEMSYVLMLILCTGHLANVATGSVSALLNMTGFQRLVQRFNVITVVLGAISFLLLFLCDSVSLLATCFVVVSQTVFLNGCLAFVAKSKLGIRTMVSLKTE